MADTKSDTVSGAGQGAATGAALGSVVPGVGTAIGAGVGAVVGGLSSYFGSKSASKKAKAAEAEARRLYEEQRQMWMSLGLPDKEASMYALENLTSAGVLVPESEKDLGQLQSQMEDIQGDPRLKQAQMDALASIQARSQGLTPEDLIQIRKTRQDISGQLANQDANIVQNLQQRGMGGSGVELAMRQAGGQRALAQASDDADSLAAMQYNARMQALQQAGAMAGSMGQQEFAQDAQKAAAMDAMSRFNMDNQMGRQQRNVAGRNMAQAANQANEQRIRDANTGFRHDEAKNKANWGQQNFLNQVMKLQGATGQTGNFAKLISDSGANKAANETAMYNAFGDAFKGVATAAGKYYDS